MTTPATLLPDNRPLALGTNLPAPRCPLCGGPTFYKTGYYQPKPHAPFFGCIRFPKCSGAVSYEQAGCDAYGVDPDPDMTEYYTDVFHHDIGDRD